MPYIEKDERDELEPLLKEAEKLCLESLPSGALNYLITKLLLMTDPSCYDDFNEIIGLLECVKFEFYRRAVAVYEDRKRKQNGDVFEGGRNGYDN